MIDVDAGVLQCSFVGDDCGADDCDDDVGGEDEVVTMIVMVMTMIVMVVTATCQRRREAKLNVLHENLLKDLKIHFRQIFAEKYNLPSIRQMPSTFVFSTFARTAFSFLISCCFF